ncbi:aminoacyl-tRNA deacylase [Thermomonospora umbrina]|uniref:Prolyl-tRNA editing enzyme YbaK/EbsC (Cys-tRNA(Pro) deacylase) n=1 Tax=Thermomonospora umbrina TaxID=111806 RepID=A0A3D9SW84_9ACTN|nr:YbaK/EbsC family protein [Thermomonospora umbrina]REE97255.1 prolyl-tRNA editing enzyme YbaK/EbsC (Cys-tRNA(Pro) deacylase) [Thermomonospora umbrina]
MKNALTIHRALLARETVHEIVRLRHPVTSADELPRALDLPPDRCLATRMLDCLDDLRGERFLAALVVTAGTRPDLGPVRAALGARVIRPAGPALVNSVTDYHADLVCPLLLPATVPMLIDQSDLDRVRPEEVVYTATGEPRIAVGLRLADVYEMSGAKPIGLSSAR